MRKIVVQIWLFGDRFPRARRHGHDPNDQRYDHDLESKVKRMPREELDRLRHDKRNSLS